MKRERKKKRGRKRNPGVLRQLGKRCNFCLGGESCTVIMYHFVSRFAYRCDGSITRGVSLVTQGAGSFLNDLLLRGNGLHSVPILSHLRAYAIRPKYDSGLRTSLWANTSYYDIIYFLALAISKRHITPIHFPSPRSLAPFSTDEEPIQQNRRAGYDMANQSPPIKNAPHKSSLDGNTGERIQ